MPRFHLLVAILVTVATLGLAPSASAHYNPTKGRWLERDPIGYVDGLSMYEYVTGDPLGHIDPLGLHKQDRWYDIPAELKNNRDFRRFVECSKEGRPLPRGFQYSRDDLLRLAREWAETGTISSSARQRISRALRSLRGGAGGLALIGLSWYFLVESAEAALYSDTSACRNFLEKIAKAASGEACDIPEIERWGTKCAEDAHDAIAAQVNDKVAITVKGTIEAYVRDVVEACRSPSRCEPRSGAPPGGSPKAVAVSSCQNASSVPP